MRRSVEPSHVEGNDCQCRDCGKRLTTPETWAAVHALSAAQEALERMTATHTCHPGFPCFLCETARAAAVIVDLCRVQLECNQHASPRAVRQGARLFHGIRPGIAVRLAAPR